jgi:hypothetical protein
MNTQVFDILSAATSRDYETLKNLPKIEDLKIAEQVEEIIRNLAINYKDRELINSYPIKARKALLDYVDNKKVFKFLLDAFFSKDSNHSLDMPSYVFEKITSKKIFKNLIEREIHPYFHDLCDEGKKAYIRALEDFEMKPYVAIDILEWLLENTKHELYDFCTNEVDDFGYDAPKRKKHESKNSHIERWIDKIKKEDKLRS